MADRVAQLLKTLPHKPTGWMESARVHDRLMSAANPSATRELWKYTPLPPFVAGLADAPVVEPALDGTDQPGVEQLRLTASGRAFPDGPGDNIAAARFPLADAALLLSGDALLVRVTGATDQPLDLEFNNGLNLPVLIELAEGSSAAITERCTGAGFFNRSVYIRMGRGARLTHARCAFDPAACDWSLLQVDVASDASYELQQYHSGGSRRRSETQIILSGRNARASVTGASRVDDATHLDQQLVVEHRAPMTISEQAFHGIGAGKGSLVFNGRIHIHEHCPAADAQLSSRSLSLHPDAQINTKPELEIYTDDVKCAHGATIGQLSADSEFYLRSRGMDAAAARLMLCRAFINECLTGPLADYARENLLTNLPASTTEAPTGSEQ